MKKCTICNKEITSEDAPILVMGAYGNPKLLCDDCSADLDTVTEATDYSDIAEAMDRLGKRMTDNAPDPQTLNTVNDILSEAALRAKEIRDGSYDFSRDAEEASEDTESFDEIPEELCETEEDKEKDRLDEEKQKQFDKIFNWIALGALIGVVIFVIWQILDAYVF